MPTITVRQSIFVEVELTDEELADYDNVEDFVQDDINEVMNRAGAEIRAGNFTYGDDVAVLDEDGDELFSCD